MKTIAAAISAFNMVPSTTSASSTDANIPTSIGIPAGTIGLGKGGRQHSLDEWVDVEKMSSMQAAQLPW